MVATGEIKIKHTAERFAVKQHVVAEGVCVYRATRHGFIGRQAGQVVLKRQFVCQQLPLVLNLVGAPAHIARGTTVRLRLGGMDDISLDVQGHFAALIGDDPGQEPASEADEEEVAGPIAIAVDLSDADGEAPTPTSP